MIKNLEIENFKSIKHLKLDCKRINIFIGEPNTGKSNILETFGLLSHICYGHIKDFVRFESMTNLFHDENLEDKIVIRFDEAAFQVEFEDRKFIGIYNSETSRTEAFSYNYGAGGSRSPLPELGPFKFYRFKVREDFPRPESDFLLPPSADNLLAIILTHKELRKLMKQIFDEYGLRVVIKPQENKIEVQKESEDIIISHPYSLVSDTLQRVIFHIVAIETNNDSVIAFEEPESHALPDESKTDERGRTGRDNGFGFGYLLQYRKIFAGREMIIYTECKPDTALVNDGEKLNKEINLRIDKREKLIQDLRENSRMMTALEKAIKARMQK